MKRFNLGMARPRERGRSLKGLRNDPDFGFGIASSEWRRNGSSCLGADAISQYPFCIQGDDNPGWSGCSFNTLAACQAAASGTSAECLSNPWYQAGTNAAPDPDGNQIGANSPLPVGPPPN